MTTATITVMIVVVASTTTHATTTTMTTTAIIVTIATTITITDDNGGDGGRASHTRLVALGLLRLSKKSCALTINYSFWPSESYYPCYNLLVYDSNFPSRSYLDFDFQACIVAFCEHKLFWFLISYSRQPSRHGSISLFNVEVDTGHLDMVFSEETSGNFDIKWNPPGGHASPFLAQADADGYLRIKMLEGSCNGVEGVHLKEITNEKISNSMCQYLDWNPSAACITVGLSDGSVSIVSLLESKLEFKKSGRHMILNFGQPPLISTNQIWLYTGPDDCKLCCWDL
ncbi:Diphthamide biosynthesis protein 7-like isoformX1 [Spatholobus suberectus]|nr:Diphthamide biosynthesis protein 7-like isoformX1 [Spatholobus suberectus]